MKHTEKLLGLEKFRKFRSDPMEIVVKQKPKHRLEGYIQRQQISHIQSDIITLAVSFLRTLIRIDEDPTLITLFSRCCYFRFPECPTRVAIVSLLERHCAVPDGGLCSRRWVSPGGGRLRATTCSTGQLQGPPWPPSACGLHPRF